MAEGITLTARDREGRYREVVAQLDAVMDGPVAPLVFTTAAVDEVRAELLRTRAPIIDFFGIHMSRVEEQLGARGLREARRLHGVGDVASHAGVGEGRELAVGARQVDRHHGDEPGDHPLGGLGEQPPGITGEAHQCDREKHQREQQVDHADVAPILSGLLSHCAPPPVRHRHEHSG